mgnify:CR=1 FL=1
MSERTAARLRDALEQDIATGELVPGTRLDEATLAERFGVSRTPIREALLELAGSGLVEHRPRRGAVVSRVDAGRLFEMFEVMAELEGMCGRLAARRMADWQRAALSEACSACEKAAASGDPDAYYYENERFHHVIYAACGNTFLADEARRLHRRLKPYRRLQLRVHNRMTTSLAEHKAIVDAILTGDPDAAEAQLKAHIAVQGERFGDLVANLNRLEESAAAT